MKRKKEKIHNERWFLRTDVTLYPPGTRHFTPMIDYLKKSLHAARTQRWQGKVCPATWMVKSNIKLSSRNDLSAVRSCSPWDSAVWSKDWRSGAPWHCWISDLPFGGHWLVKQGGDVWDPSIFTTSGNLIEERRRSSMRTECLPSSPVCTTDV